MPVQYAKFKYYSAFVNKNSFAGPSQRVCHAYSRKSSVVKLFLKKKISKVKFDKADNFVYRTIMIWGMSDRWNQNFWLVGWEENLCQLFKLVDKWYVRQIKLFNLINCPAIDTSGKLDVRQVTWVWEYSVRMRENMDQNNFEYEHFSLNDYQKVKNHFAPYSKPSLFIEGHV